jgi:hypothetical protein
MAADFADNRPIVGTELGQRLGTRSPSPRWLCQSASSALLSSANAAQAKGLLTFAPVGLPPILLNMSTFSHRTAAQKFRLASKLTDTMGNRQTAA